MDCFDGIQGVFGYSENISRAIIHEKLNKIFAYDKGSKSYTFKNVTARAAGNWGSDEGIRGVYVSADNWSDLDDFISVMNKLVGSLPSSAELKAVTVKTKVPLTEPRTFSAKLDDCGERVVHHIRSINGYIDCEDNSYMYELLSTSKGLSVSLTDIIEDEITLGSIASLAGLCKNTLLSHIEVDQK